MSHITEVEEFHQAGSLSICNLQAVTDCLNISVERGNQVDVGLRVSMDGRIWLCVNGIAFIRFKPRTPQMKFDPVGGSQLAAEVDQLRDKNEELSSRLERIEDSLSALRYAIMDGEV